MDSRSSTRVRGLVRIADTISGRSTVFAGQGLVGKSWFYMLMPGCRFAKILRLIEARKHVYVVLADTGRRASAKESVVVSEVRAT
jgi:hypothetical protein